MMKKITVLVICLMMLSTSVFAASSPWNNPKASYGQQAMHKFAYGLTNTVLGWSKIFTKPYEAASNHTDFATGVVTGLWQGVADTVGGVLHLVTFPIPQIDIPLPDGGISFACCKA